MQEVLQVYFPPLISTAEEQSIAASTAKRSKSSVTTPNTTPCQTLSNVSMSTLFNLFANRSFHKDIKSQLGALNSLER